VVASSGTLSRRNLPESDRVTNLQGMAVLAIQKVWAETLSPGGRMALSFDPYDDGQS